MHSLRSVLRLSFVLLAATPSIELASAQGDSSSSEPFVVYVAEEGAYARCGPSGDYYRTDPLRHGQSLDVYAETDDGWLGIRPPEGSFCWIIAETIDVDPGEEHGTIVEDRTVAWIGTHLGRARKYRWQVQLAKGESVTVIGRSEREGPDGPQLWYRVVPPSGEFRWLHRNQVVSNSVELIASVDRRVDQEIEFLPGGQTNPAPQKIVSTEPSEVQSAATSSASASSRRRSPPRRSQANVEASRSIGNAFDAHSSRPDPATIGSGLKENWQASTAREATRQTTSNSVRQLEPSAPARSNAIARPVGRMASIEFRGQPRLLDIGSQSVAPSGRETAGDQNWVSGAARSGTQPVASIATSLPTMVAAGAGDGVIRQVAGQQSIVTTIPAITGVSAEQIARVEQETRGADVERLSLILSRLMAARATAAEAEPVVRAAGMLAASSADPVTAGRARLLAERAEQYRRVSRRRDGDVVVASNVVPVIPPAPPVAAIPPRQTSVSQVGYLVQVYSARSNSPPFALTDHSGRTLVYVTPVPGVNIRMHLNSHVKVTGRQGFLRGLNTPHLLVSSAFRAPE